MAATQELFRFTTTRRPDRAVMSRLDARLIRDSRPAGPPSLLVPLFTPGEFAPKLVTADGFALSDSFLAADSPVVVAIEPFSTYLRQALAPGVDLAVLVADITAQFPLLARLLGALDDGPLESTLAEVFARWWDSLYAQTIRGCDRFVTTNYLIDGLRSYHLLSRLHERVSAGDLAWQGAAFDDYEAIIDLAAAAAAASTAPLPHEPADLPGGAGTIPGPVGRASAPLPPPMTVSAPGFRVPLEVGPVRPPIIGDLLVVEQELRRYELGELADIESVMRGERRERTIRTLARTSQTTTTERSTENEQSSSVRSDERFQLSTEAQQTASKSLSVQAGINVSGKFGPVQVGATVNAAFNTSSSSSESTATDFAKTVTEEASQRVRSNFKESTSVTVLTESQDTSLRGWNNEAGTTHVNGLYRWLDKVYDASLLNYGRRLMISVTVPEPATFYRAQLQAKAEVALATLAEPVHPARIDRGSFAVLSAGSTDGFRSFEDIDEDNYAQLAALYDVAPAPPPTEYLTGSQAVAHPDAMQATVMKEHDSGDLSLVTASTTLTVDPGYRLTRIGVLAPEGEDGLDDYVNALKLGEDGKDVADANSIMVQVAGESFHLRAYKDDKDAKIVDTNFNSYKTLHHGDFPFAESILPGLPVTVAANFEGMFTVTIAYTAERTPRAYDAWKAATYAAIVAAYTSRRRAYEQSLALAQSKVESATVAQTFALREDQYRAIELTELKRGCIDLLTAGTAAGRSSINVDGTGVPSMVYTQSDHTGPDEWRAPLGAGTVAELFELAFDWGNAAYQFFPYYWAGASRWNGLSLTEGADPVFEQFLRSGSASVVVPVQPGFERTVTFFLKTGLIWGGGYLSLFTSPEMLDVYADVELGRVFDPPLKIGESWEIRMPTSLVMLQDDDTLPEFQVEAPPTS